MNKRILTLFLFILLLLLFFVCSGLSEASDNIDKETKTNITVKDIKVAENRNTARLDYIISGSTNDSYRAEFSAFKRSNNSSNII